MVNEAREQFLRLANDTKAAEQDDGAIPDALQSLFDIANALVDHEITGGFISLRFDPLLPAVARQSSRNHDV
jgi:hypothetical protein